MIEFSNTPAPVKGGVVTYLAVDGAIKAVEFYQTAFGAEVATVYAPDDKGRTMHAHIYVNGSSLMLSDFFPEQGVAVVAPAGFSVMILTSTIDADYQRAVDAGATPLMPPTDMFWGDRYAQVRDPFGITWAMNQGAPQA